MTNNEALYAKIKLHYPDMHDTCIGKLMGLPGSISKVKNTPNPNVKVARWMAEHHEDCQDVYQGALKNAAEARAVAGKKRTKYKKPGGKFVMKQPVFAAPWPQAECVSRL